jgi:hypothetical protein
MKTKNLLSFFVLLSFWYVFNSNSSGPQLGYSGAPGEGTCSTQGGCHNNGKFTGGVASITGLPAEVEAGKSYPLVLSCVMAGAVNGGFQLTALDGTNKSIGTMVASAGQAVGNNAANGRSYLLQTKAGTFASNKIIFNVNWTAPTTASNKDITLYTSILAGNNSKSNAGDNAFTATAKTTFKTNATNDFALTNAISIFPNPTTDVLNIKVNEFQNVDFTLCNEFGQAVLAARLNENNSFDVSNFSKGVYFVKINTGTKQAVKAVVLQ